MSTKTYDIPARVVTGPVSLGAVPLNTAPISSGLAGSEEMIAEFAQATEKYAHEGELQPCTHCQHEGHFVHWQGYPVLDPGPCPPDDVITDLVEACFCCFWGPGPLKIGESLYGRLTRQAWRGYDVKVEHRTKAGLWVKIDGRFGAVA